MPPVRGTGTQPPPGRIPSSVTAEERRWLNEDGIGEKEKRRRARVLRNRQSAQK
jgi:hypothetical protein